MALRLTHRAATEGELEIGQAILRHSEELIGASMARWWSAFDFMDMHVVVLNTGKPHTPAITCYEPDPNGSLFATHSNRYWTLILVGAGSVSYVDENLFHKHMLVLKMSSYATSRA